MQHCPMTGSVVACEAAIVALAESMERSFHDGVVHAPEVPVSAEEAERVDRLKMERDAHLSKEAARCGLIADDVQHHFAVLHSLLNQLPDFPCHAIDQDIAALERENKALTNAVVKAFDEVADLEARLEEKLLQ